LTWNRDLDLAEDAVKNKDDDSLLSGRVLCFTRLTTLTFWNYDCSLLLSGAFWNDLFFVSQREVINWRRNSLTIAMGDWCQNVAHSGGVTHGDCSIWWVWPNM